MSCLVSILEKVREVLGHLTLCPNCLGRQYGTLLSATSNQARGEALLLSTGMELLQSVIAGQGSPEDFGPLLRTGFPPLLTVTKRFGALDEREDCRPRPCYICEGLFDEDRLGEVVQRIGQASGGYEFRSFLVGCHFPASMVEREEEVRARFGLSHGEAFKSEFNREVGKRVLQLWPTKEVEFDRPEILFIVDLSSFDVEVNSNPLFVEGSYRKLVRGIPQSTWHCGHCRGKGCATCNQTGRNYPDSVEEYVCTPIQEAAGGWEVKFHGSGREDVDALMLGSGRPFVVEVSKPRVRSLDLATLERRINVAAGGRVDVVLTRVSERMMVRQIKGQSRQMAKRYKMKVLLDQPVDWEEMLGKIHAQMVGKVNQQTPRRVLHRRADLTRVRRVFDFKVEPLSPVLAEVEVHGEGGLYVKELVNGDEGRTSPSLSALLGIGVAVQYLDVLAVESGVPASGPS